MNHNELSVIEFASEAMSLLDSFLIKHTTGYDVNIVAGEIEDLLMCVPKEVEDYHDELMS